MPRIEAAARFDFPFAVNPNVKGKTPYYKYYETAILEKRRKVSKSNNLDSPFPGLSLYDFSGMSTLRFWIPNEPFSEATRLGNPLIFFCAGPICTLELDMGNGWLISAEFDEQALVSWKDLYKNIYKSADAVVGG